MSGKIIFTGGFWSYYLQLLVILILGGAITYSLILSGIPIVGAIVALLLVAYLPWWATKYFYTHLKDRDGSRCDSALQENRWKSQEAINPLTLK